MLNKALDLGRLLARGLVQLIYPNVCWICGVALEEAEAGFCTTCRDSLTHDPFQSCPRCAATVGPFVDLAGGCVHCRNESFAFERAVRLGVYENTLRDVILRLKSLHGEGLAERVGQLWAAQAGDKLRALEADVIVPVPLHWRRRLRRGYNQSDALARGLARVLKLPVRRGWLRRVRATPLQPAQSGRAARAENVRGAFQTPRNLTLAGKSVLLVDDVMTTGATAHEAARALRTAKPERIMVAVLARAALT